MRWIRSVGLVVALLLFPQAGFAQATGTVTGIVTGTADRPLQGAAVTVQGTGRGTTTDAQGRYSITGVPGGTQTLRATFAGYQEVQRTISVTAGQPLTANVSLTAQAVKLEEVVAIGYGTARRRDLTGSVASVSGEDAVVKAAPTTSVANALQGRAAGVQVISNSGAPGAGASVRVRGTNSITANSEPLYVVDGIPFGQGSTAEGTQNPLASIDPNDIASIQILKDASSTAIYGARGANGVVLITTKRGQAGSTQIQLESSYGVQTVPRTIEFLNAQEFMTLGNEAQMNIGLPARYTQAEISAAHTYDLLGMLLQTAPQQSHALTVSGGDQQTRFLLSGSYLQQDGVVIGTDFTRYGTRVNLERELRPGLRAGANLGGTYSVQNVGETEGNATFGSVYSAMSWLPYLAPKDADGNWVQLSASTGDIVINPVSVQEELVNPRRTTSILGSFFGEYDVAEGFRLRSTIGTNLNFRSSPYFAPRTIYYGSPTGLAVRSEAMNRELTSETTLSYNRELGPGTLDALAGFSVQTSHAEDTRAEVRQLVSDALEFNNLGAGSDIRAPSSNVVDWAVLSQLGRINYNLLDRYLFTVTVRRDGSSRFGANSKWAVFPSAALAWRLIDEPFLPEQTFFSDLKLRASYGRTGNQAVGEYASLARLGTVFAGFGTPPSAQVALAPANVAPNPDLKWETQDQVNLGLDLGVLDNRVTLSLDGYQTTTSDLLLTVNLSTLSGYSTQLQNIGSVRNRGLELALNTINFEGDRFRWRSTLNLAMNRNEVTEIGGAASIVVGIGQGGNAIIKPGEPIGSFYGYKVLGLWQQGDQCTIAPATECTPGEYKLQDTNGDGRITDGDRVIIGRADPRFFGGLNNQLSYGPISLDAFLNFSYGNEVFNSNNSRSMVVRGILNERKEVLNRWTPTNTNTMIPRANATRSVTRMFSTLVEDGSFARLQTLTLSYDVPSSLVPGSSRARLYLTGQNVWLVSDYSGFDPEVNRFGGAAASRGVDNSSIPRPRVWNVGVNLNF
jgi:TonB-dependent starch-binding outer membrane protein SusC